MANDLIYIKHGDYGATLFDPRWRKKRKMILHRDSHKCKNCGSNIELQVHHRQYHFSKTNKKFKDPWDYDPKYLITLCKICHQKGHSKYEVPTKIIG